jgi:hypothetical protein
MKIENIKKVGDVVSDVCDLLQKEHCSREDGLNILAVLVGALLGEKRDAERTTEFFNFIDLVNDIADKRTKMVSDRAHK